MMRNRYVLKDGQGQLVYGCKGPRTYKTLKAVIANNKGNRYRVVDLDELIELTMAEAKAHVKGKA